MKNKALSKINPHAKRIKLDDYELPSEFPFDRSTMKPNPYAGRVKFTHGGARKGAGRKPAPYPAERHMISFYKPDVKLLRALDPNLSRAIRKLIERTSAH